MNSTTLFTHGNGPLLPFNYSGGAGSIGSADDGNESYAQHPGGASSGHNLAVRVATGFGLYILALLTCVGNGMVIQAIRTEKRLRKVSNLFIMSLAVADLVVGACVMPISAIYVLTDRWYLGKWMCEAWLSIDYCASTASIFNLFVLSLDRYWSITSPLKYLRRRTKRRAFFMIASAWALSLLWILPVTGWHRMVGLPDHAYNNLYICDTDFADNIAFKVTTAVANFYVPTLSMLYIYGRIFCTIRQRGRKDLGEVTATAGINSTRRMPQPASASPVTAVETNVVSDNGDTISLQTTEAVGVMMEEVTAAAAPLSGRNRARRRLKSRWWCAPKKSDASSSRHPTPSDISMTSGTSRPPTRAASAGRLVDYYESLTLLEVGNLANHQMDNVNAPPADGRGASHYDNVRVNVEYIEGSPVIPAEVSGSATAAAAAAVISNQNGGEMSGNTRTEASQASSSRGMLRSISSSNTIAATAAAASTAPSSSTGLIPLKERKAARQLGVIMAAFIVCWLPYFIVFMVVAGCDDCVDATLFKVTLWLGYVNSTLNPVLYPLCNANFRRAFAKMLAKSCCRTSHPQHRTHPLPSSGSVLTAHHHNHHHNHNQSQSRY